MVITRSFNICMRKNAAWLHYPALSPSDWVALWKFTFTKRTKWGWERHAWHLPNLPWITDSLALSCMCTQQHEKQKTMPHFSGGVVTRLVQSYLLPFHKRCLSFVLVCSNIWSLLFTMETKETQMLKRTIALLPSGRSCVSTRRHRLARRKTFWHNYSITALCNAFMCAMSLPSHLNSKLKQTAYSVTPTPESIEHPVRVSTAWQSVRQPQQMPDGRESYSLPSGMIPWS